MTAIDTRLESLRRRARADHEDEGAIALLASALERTGADILAPLRERATWQKASRVDQDLAIFEVRRRRPDDLEYLGMRVWSCLNRVLENESFGTVGHRTISHRLGLFRHKKTGAEFSLVPGSRGPEFPWDEKGVPGLDQSIAPLFVARWPVTNRQMLRAIPNSTHKDNNLPRVSITHARTEELLKEGKALHGLRLPSADEWEHFARAGTTTRFYFADEISDEHVWHSGNTGAGLPVNVPHCYHSPGPVPTGLHERAKRWNACGLVDLIGNVAEWTKDTEPHADGAARVMGGSYALPSDVIASRPLDGSATWARGAQSTIGFRPVADIPGI